MFILRTDSLHKHKQTNTEDKHAVLILWHDRGDWIPPSMKLHLWAQGSHWGEAGAFIMRSGILHSVWFREIKGFSRFVTGAEGWLQSGYAEGRDLYFKFDDMFGVNCSFVWCCQKQLYWTSVWTHTLDSTPVLRCFQCPEEQFKGT